MALNKNIIERKAAPPIDRRLLRAPPKYMGGATAKAMRLNRSYLDVSTKTQCILRSSAKS